MVVWWHDGVGETSMVSGDDDVRDNGGRYRSNDVMMMIVIGLEAKRNDEDQWWGDEGDGRTRRDGESDDGGRGDDDVEETERMTKWKGFGRPQGETDGDVDDGWCDCGEIYGKDDDDFLRGGGIEVWSMLVVKMVGRKGNGGGDE